MDTFSKIPTEDVPMSLPLPDEPPDDRCREWEIELPPVPQASRCAREFVRLQLTRFGCPELVDDGALIAVELVTNAVREAPDGPIFLTLRLSAGEGVIEVRDCSPVPPVTKEPDFAAENGRGLHIVGALAVRTGWHRAGRGKTVWAVLR
jgi:anti-sigma regulatory factor (Ser/Thr protein kinase)